MARVLSSWDMIDAGKYADEGEVVRGLLERQPLGDRDRADIVAEAVALVESARGADRKQGVVESFLQQFSLGTREGLALM